MENPNLVPLIAGFQRNDVEVPTNFSVTCFKFLRPEGIFKNLFDLDELIACGTDEGPIILVGIGGRGEKSANRVSLLYGHIHRITDFEAIIHENSFLSISSDCTICCWSVFDGSCVFKYELNLSMGEYHISICPQDPSFIWIWKVGSNAFLFSRDAKAIVSSMTLPGLRSLSIISPYSSYCVSSTVAICHLLNKIVTYSLNDDQTFDLNSIKSIENLEPLKDSYAIRKCGVIKYTKSNGNWAIIRPLDGFQLLSGSFKIDDDCIADIKWDYSTQFCIASYKSNFLVVTIKKNDTANEESNLAIASSIQLSFNSFMNFFAYDENSNIVYTPESKRIIFASEKESLIIHKNQLSSNHLDVSNPKKVQYFIQNSSNEELFINSDGHSCISLYNLLTNQKEKTYQFEGKITAIFSRSTTVHASTFSQIAIGFSDGRITLLTFDRGQAAKDSTFFEFSSPVLAFVEPPYKQRGRYLLLAVSKTSCCLFKWNELLFQFNLGNFTILTIYYVIESELFIFGLNTGGYYVLNIKDSSPFDVLTQLPKEAILLYSQCSNINLKNLFKEKKKKEKTNHIASICINMAGESIWLRFVNILSLYQILNDKDPPSNCEELLNKFLKLVDEFQKNEVSLLIIGYDKTPTLFYPPYFINSNNFLYLSPLNAAKFFIADSLAHRIEKISNFSSNENLIESEEALFEIENLIQNRCTNENDAKLCSEMLPIFIKLLFVGDKTIQTISLIACASLDYLISFEKSQKIFSPYLNENYNHLMYSDLLLFSLIASKYKNALTNDILPKLYQFLVNPIPNENWAVSAMKAYILIDGILVWVDYDDQEMIYFHILSFIITHIVPRFLYNRFLSFIFSDLEMISSLIPKFIKAILPSSSNELIYKALNLFSDIEINNMKQAGGLMINAVAISGGVNLLVSELALKIIRSKAQLIPYVDVSNKYTVIGTSDGNIYIYANSKMKAHKNIFSFKIDQVSISPKCNFAIALSEEDLCCKIFQLKSSCKIIRKIDIIQAIPGTRYSINWVCEDNASVSFVPLE